MNVSVFKNAKDNQPRNQKTPWAFFTNRLTQHEARAEKDGPLWSPTLYRQGATRGNAGVVSLSCFVADVDDGTPPAALIERWAGLTWCLYSTHSSTADKPKWRVVFPLAAPVPAEEWRKTWRRLTHHLMDGHNDAATKDPARIHYLPAAPPERIAEAFVDQADGELLDPNAYDDPPEVEAVARLVEYQRRKPISGAHANGVRPGDAYKETATVETVVRLLESVGWRAERSQGSAVYLTRPGKKEGVSGVVGWPGDPAPLFYVFTSSSPPFEAGKVYDAFGVLAHAMFAGDFKSAAKSLTVRKERRAREQRLVSEQDAKWWEGMNQ